jgi:hypothetical protein
MIAKSSLHPIILPKHDSAFNFCPSPEVELDGFECMSDGDFLRAIELLERHYGRLDLDACRLNWAGSVRFVLERQWSATKFAKIWPELSETWLVDVEEVARCRREELWEFLQNHECNASLVAFLHKLAIWWQAEVEQGRDPLDSTFQATDADSEEAATEWQKLVVRQDRSLATRLACVIFGARQFPITRGIWRVACRHEWISWHDDPADAPGFFEAQLARVPIDFAQVSEWLIQVAEDYCGGKSKCPTCPLLPLLGPNGPCEFEE